MYGKENFPYSEAAYYSSMLWHTQAEGKVVVHNVLLQCEPSNQVGVILTIVSARKRREDSKLDSYIR